MTEIKTKPKPLSLEEGVPYIPYADEVVFTENHTISDILRYAAEQNGGDLDEYNLKVPK